jgi:Mg-chelatase subunit ChlD
MGNKQPQSNNLSNSNSRPQSFLSSMFSSEKLVEDKIDESKQNIEANLNINLADVLEFSLSAKNSAIKLNKEENQKLPVMINLSTKKKLEEEKTLEFRPPIDLICVVDTSGSMSGNKINLVQQTLKYLLTIMKEYDRLCLINFENQATILTGLHLVTSDRKPLFEENILKLKASGGTNIQSGVEMALNVLKNRANKNKVTSIFLLSDGLDNNQSTLVSRIRQSIDKYAIPDVFTINTFGFGNDHDPESMRKIAETKDGDFYYIEKLDLVDEFFVAAFGGLASIIAENVHIKIEANPFPILNDLRICKVYGDFWVYDSNTKVYVFNMSQLMLGISRELVVELNIPPSKKNVEDLQRNQVFLKGSLELTEIKNKKVIKIEKELNLTIYNENEEIPEFQKKENENVVINYMRVNGAEVIKQARELADQGKYEESKAAIDDGLKNVGKKYEGNPMIKPLIDDLNNMKEMVNPQEYLERGQKFFHGQERFHANQKLTNLSSNYESAYANMGQERMLKSLRSKK